MKVKKEESLYVQILRWTYERQNEGFTEEELLINFKLNNKDGRGWYTKVFRDRTVLIDPINYSDKWTLTSEGMSAAVNYLNLKEAEESGKHARIIAFWSIGIGIAVGVIQIILQIYK